MTTSVIQYRAVNSSGTVTQDREATLYAIDHTVTSAQDSANAAAITLSNVGNVQSVLSAQIASTGNVLRAPQGAVTISGGTVTVNDTGLAVSEVIKLVVVGFPA